MKQKSVNMKSIKIPCRDEFERASKDEVLFKSLTGIDFKHFKRLLKVFRVGIKAERSIETMKKQYNKKYDGIMSDLECRLYIVIKKARKRLTTYETADMAGLKKSRSDLLVKKDMKRLNLGLEKNGYMPLNENSTTEKDFFLKKNRKYAGDCFAQRKNKRNVPFKEAKKDFSGYYGCTCGKMFILIDLITGKIVYFIQEKIGSMHDINIAKGFFANFNFDKTVKFLLDLGFYGMYLYTNATILTPIKALQNHVLTKEEESYNAGLSGERAHVERAIGLMKRYEILSEKSRCRPKARTLYNSVVAGLTNFYIENKNWFKNKSILA